MKLKVGMRIGDHKYCKLQTLSQKAEILNLIGFKFNEHHDFATRTSENIAIATAKYNNIS